jgi:hypothetical protein
MKQPKRARASRSKSIETTAKESAQLRPRVILRVEGLLVLVAAVVAYTQTGRSWGLFLCAFLLPDLGLMGYLKNHGVGAWLYNLSHTTVLPLVWANPMAGPHWLGPHVGLWTAISGRLQDYPPAKNLTTRKQAHAFGA